MPDIDEPIVIVDYDPQWPLLFLGERERVSAALGAVVFAIEHFGSTAVPGMAGKPIVDLLVGVADLGVAAECVSALEDLGYENFGEIFVPGRLYLRRRGPPHFNVALTAAGGEFWNTQLAVRDYLRMHPEEAAAYAQEKRVAFAAGARLFSSFSQRKAPFLAALVERALRWRAAYAR